jgi:hypothetical protein
MADGVCCNPTLLVTRVCALHPSTAPQPSPYRCQQTAAHCTPCGQSTGLPHKGCGWLMWPSFGSLRWPVLHIEMLLLLRLTQRWQGPWCWWYRRSAHAKDSKQTHMQGVEGGRVTAHQSTPQHSTARGKSSHHKPTQTSA